MERGRFLEALGELRVQPGDLRALPRKRLEPRKRTALRAGTVERAPGANARAARLSRSLRAWVEERVEVVEDGEERVADLLADAVAWHEERFLERPNSIGVGRRLSELMGRRTSSVRKQDGERFRVWEGLRLRPLGTPGAPGAIGGGERGGSVLSTREAE